MPRPRPLTNISTALPPAEEQQLTPRTPHHNRDGSRTSRAEQGFSKLQLADADDGDYDALDDNLQSAPLLASSSTARFSVRSIHLDDRRSSTKLTSPRKPASRSAEFFSLVISRLPLAIGVLLGGVLLILIFLSLTRPEALHRYVGASLPTTGAARLKNTATPTHGAHTAHMTETKLKGAVHHLSYENYTTFPLHPNEYLTECAKLHQGFMSHGEYWDVGHMGPMDVLHHSGKDVCSSTITYMLDGMVGLTADLALMAQAAALARERNRTFLIDDTYWNRGKWKDHFEDVRTLQPGPEPGCKPPPPKELVACPRTARHWIINSRTAKFHFGHGFSENYENPYGHDLNRLKPIYESSLRSLQSTIKPNAQNQELIRLAKSELSSLVQEVESRDEAYVAVHIRRGDRRPASYTYPNHRIPIEDYVTFAKQTWRRLTKYKESPIVYIASDSFDAESEFSKALQGDVFSLFRTGDPRLRALASSGEYYQAQFDRLDLHAKVQATRGMIVDLALVSGLWAEPGDLLPEAIVCSISSNVCKIAAMGLGWERAFGKVDAMGQMDNAHKRWVEIDERGNIIPLWKAFELF